MAVAYDSRMFGQSPHVKIGLHITSVQIGRNVFKIGNAQEPTFSLHNQASEKIK